MQQGDELIAIDDTPLSGQSPFQAASLLQVRCCSLPPYAQVMAGLLQAIDPGHQALLLRQCSHNYYFQLLQGACFRGRGILGPTEPHAHLQGDINSSAAIGGSAAVASAAPATATLHLQKADGSSVTLHLPRPVRCDCLGILVQDVDTST